MKVIVYFWAVMLISMSINMNVFAKEKNGCFVTAETVTVTDIGQVQVPIKISGNPGFTNFGIALDYDRDQLELLGIYTNDEENLSLIGEHVSVNTAWTDQDENVYGYITGASSSIIEDDGILFTVVFEMKEEFSEAATVVPILKYMRSIAEDYSSFENLSMTSKSGDVVLQPKDNETIVSGDFDNNGQFNITDITSAIIAFQNKTELSDVQKAIIDTDGDGHVSEIELKELAYKYLNRKRDQTDPER